MAVPVPVFAEKLCPALHYGSQASPVDLAASKPTASPMSASVIRIPKLVASMQNDVLEKPLRGYRNS
jgi:hypothetical protein